MKILPTTLAGRLVHLKPMCQEHTLGLWEAGDNPDIWEWNIDPVTSMEGMQRYVESALESQNEGKALPFIIFENKSQKIIGSTRYGNIEPKHKRLEIGWTWLNPAWWRTPINTECKYLLLSYAFETLGCIRVELKTDALNQRSRNAMLRIGAKEEGTLRRHMLGSTGRVRDSVYFSILVEEWPEVKLYLEHKLSLPYVP